MDQSKIGAFIASLRKEKGVTQAQLAEYIGISNRAVSKWERGQSLPDAGHLLELCDYLGITVNELLLGERIEKEKYEEKAEEQLVEYKRSQEYADNMEMAIVVFDLLMDFILLLVAIRSKMHIAIYPSGIFVLSLIFDIKYIYNRFKGIGTDALIVIVEVSVALKAAFLMVVLIMLLAIGMADVANFSSVL